MPFYYGAAPALVTASLHLERASRVGDELWARECLLRGLDPNCRDGLGTTPLMEASLKGHSRVARLLLEQGAQVNAARQERRRGRAASQSGFAERDERALGDGRTALGDSVTLDQLEVLEALLAGGADVRLHGRGGRTALSEAVRCGNADAARLLLDPELAKQHGREPADVNQRDADNRVALSQARGEAARLLLRAGADPTLLDDQGRSPLWHVARSCSAPDLLAVQSSVCGAHRRGRETCWSVSRLDYTGEVAACQLGVQTLCPDGPPLSFTTARALRGQRTRGKALA